MAPVKAAGKAAGAATTPAKAAPAPAVSAAKAGNKTPKTPATKQGKDAATPAPATAAPADAHAHATTNTAVTPATKQAGKAKTPAPAPAPAPPKTAEKATVEVKQAETGAHGGKTPKQPQQKQAKTPKQDATVAAVTTTAAAAAAAAAAAPPPPSSTTPAGRVQVKAKKLLAQAPPPAVAPPVVEEKHDEAGEFDLHGLSPVHVLSSDKHVTAVGKVVKSAEGSSGSQLLIVFVGDALDEEALNTSLEQFGTISQIEPGHLGDAASDVRYVMVHFHEANAAKRVLKRQVQPSIEHGTHNETEWLAQYAQDRPRPKQLQADVDRWMAAFDAQEAEAEQSIKDAAASMQADGFTLVTRKRRNRDEAAVETAIAKRRRKKGPLEMSNFYRFQLRESKRDQLALLRKKFEEDKARIARMKAARQFNPF